jgi:hypothetical protein
MTLRKLLAEGLILACITAGALAQERRDPQSSFEPRSEPGAGQKLLQKMAGDWEVVKTLYPQTGEPVRVKGECRQTMIHDGRFLQSNFIFHDAGGLTTGLGLIGFDSDSGHFTSVWTDSRSTRMSIRQSQEPFNGDEIVLVSRSLRTPSPLSSSRTVSRLEDDGRKLIHRLYVAGPDGRDRLVMELAMTRKR